MAINRPILSAINTPSYKIAKFLVPLLSEFTKNKFVSKDSFEFAKYVRQQNPNLFMASFDIESLFTNLPLEETIKICVKKVFKNKKKYKGLSKNEFERLLCLAVKDSFFLFNGAYYEQLDGVAMGSPLGPTLANIFLCHWEEIWIKKCPEQFRPKYYNRFMDDTFLLFSSRENVLKFHKYINSRHKNMGFTFEVEENDSLAFLDVLVTRGVIHLTRRYTENQRLAAFILIFIVLCQITTKKVSFTRFFIGLLYFVRTGINFIQKCVFLKKHLRKTYFLSIYR